PFWRAPCSFTGFLVRLPRLAIWQGVLHVVVSQKHRHIRGMAVHWNFLVRACIPAQHAHLGILKLYLAVLRVYLRRVLGPSREDCKAHYRRQEQYSTHFSLLSYI